MSACKNTAPNCPPTVKKKTLPDSTQMPPRPQSLCPVVSASTVRPSPFSRTLLGAVNHCCGDGCRWRWHSRWPRGRMAQNVAHFPIPSPHFPSIGLNGSLSFALRTPLEHYSGVGKKNSLQRLGQTCHLSPSTLPAFQPVPVQCRSRTETETIISQIISDVAPREPFAKVCINKWVSCNAPFFVLARCSYPVDGTFCEEYSKNGTRKDMYFAWQMEG